jgi:hypothetical protein
MIDKLQTTQQFFFLFPFQTIALLAMGIFTRHAPVARLRGAEALVPVAPGWLLPVDRYHQLSIPAVDLVWGDVLISVTRFSGCYMTYQLTWYPSRAIPPVTPLRALDLYILGRQRSPHQAQSTQHAYG